MLKQWVAAWVLAAVCAGTAAAQTPSEATRWLVPVNIGPMGETAKAARVSVYNVGVRPARVALVSLTAGGRRNGDVVLLQPGRSANFPEITGPTDFGVIVSDEPVVASATIDRVETRLQTPFKVVEPTDPGQITLQNQQSNQILRGSFIPYTSIVREDVRALPLNCEGAPAGHFACSISLPRTNIVKGDTAPRPIESTTPAPAPKEPEGKYTRAPGDAGKFIQTLPKTKPQ